MNSLGIHVNNVISKNFSARATRIELSFFRLIDILLIK